jgi:hypothetical protein
MAVRGSENALEEGVGGRNLLKVSPLLGRPHQILIRSPVHTAKPQPHQRGTAGDRPQSRGGPVGQDEIAKAVRSGGRNSATTVRPKAVCWYARASLLPQRVTTAEPATVMAYLSSP